MVEISVGEKHFIHGSIAQDLRSDDRKRLTYQPVYVETGFIPQVECTCIYLNLEFLADQVELIVYLCQSFSAVSCSFAFSSDLVWKMDLQELG